MPNGRKPGQVGPQPEPRRDQPRKTLEDRSAARRLRRAKQGKPVNQPRPLIDIHVAKIVTPDPMIFPPKLRLALQYYLDTVPRDKERAAKRAGMDVDEFRKHLYSPGVIDYLRDQEALIDEKAAELRARARVLSEDRLDAATLEVLDSAATPPPQKVRMIEVGYRRFGMLKDKAEVTGANGAPLPFQLIRITGRKDDDGPDDQSAI